MKIAVLGNLTLDSVITVNQLPTKNTVQRELSRFECFGGRAANIAVMLAQLGINTSLFAVAGGDFSTSGYIDWLDKVHVSTAHVLKYPNHQCARFVSFRDRNDSHYSFFAPNVEGEFFGKLLDKGVNFSSYDYFCLAKIGDELQTLRLLEKLKKAERVIGIMAIGPDVKYCSRELLIKIIKSFRVVIMNKQEAAQVLSIGKIENLKDLFSVEKETKLETVVVTDAASGSLIFRNSAQSRLRIPAFKPTKFENSLGAGDTFVAAFIYGLMQSWSLKDVGKFASFVACYSLKSRCAQPTLPKLEVIQKQFSSSNSTGDSSPCGLTT